MEASELLLPAPGLCVDVQTTHHASGQVAFFIIAIRHIAELVKNSTRLDDGLLEKFLKQGSGRR